LYSIYVFIFATKGLLEALLDSVSSSLLDCVKRIEVGFLSLSLSLSVSLSLSHSQTHKHNTHALTPQGLKDQGAVQLLVEVEFIQTTMQVCVWVCDNVCAYERFVYEWRLSEFKQCMYVMG
jgi:hypothetical protein